MEGFCRASHVCIVDNIIMEWFLAVSSQAEEHVAGHVSLQEDHMVDKLSEEERIEVVSYP